MLVERRSFQPYGGVVDGKSLLVEIQHDGEAWSALRSHSVGGIFEFQYDSYERFVAGNAFELVRSSNKPNHTDLPEARGVTCTEDEGLRENRDRIDVRWNSNGSWGCSTAWY